MAVGLMYTASFENVSITAAAQDVWELVCAAGVGIIVHWVKLDLAPTITSGVAQDERMRLQICERSTTGTGGAAVTARGVHPRNTVAASTVATRTVTTPGTIADILWSDRASIIVPFEKIFTPDLRIPVSGGGRLCLNLAAALSGAFNANSTICWEEI